MAEEYIWVVTDEVEPEPIDGQRRSWREELGKRVSGLKQVKLPVADLEQNMGQFAAGAAAGV